MLRPYSALRDRWFPWSEMPTGGTTGESPAPHLSSSPATTCTPRAHSPLPLSRPERLSPARGALICGVRARQDPWKGPRSSNKCACQHLGRPAIRAALEPVPVKVEGGGAGTMVAVECAAIHQRHRTTCRNTPHRDRHRGEISAASCRLGLERGGTCRQW